MCYLEVAWYRSTWHHIYTSRSWFHWVLKICSLIWLLRLSYDCQSCAGQSMLVRPRRQVRMRIHRIKNVFGHDSYSLDLNKFMANRLTDEAVMYASYCLRGIQFVHVHCSADGWDHEQALTHWLVLGAVRCNQFGIPNHWNKFHAASCTKRSRRRKTM